MTLRSFPANSAERRTMLSIIACEQQCREHNVDLAKRKRLQADNSDSLGEVYFQHNYVGNNPIREGMYLVIDKDTSTILSVALSVTSNGHRIVWPIREARSTLLENWNMRSFRWFLLSELDSEDERMLRELPLVKATPTIVG